MRHRIQRGIREVVRRVPQRRQSFECLPAQVGRHAGLYVCRIGARTHRMRDGMSEQDELCRHGGSIGEARVKEPRQSLPCQRLVVAAELRRGEIHAKLDTVHRERVQPKEAVEVVVFGDAEFSPPTTIDQPSQILLDARSCLLQITDGDHVRVSVRRAPSLRQEGAEIDERRARLQHDAPVTLRPDLLLQRRQRLQRASGLLGRIL